MVEFESGGSTAAGVMRKICRVMMERQISALPRNYELLFEALSGRRPDLLRDLAALGSEPEQRLLDELGLRHRLPGHLALQLNRIHKLAHESLVALEQPVMDLGAVNALMTTRLEDLWDRIAEAPLAATDFAEETRALREVVAQLRRKEKQISATVCETRETLKVAAREIEESRKSGNVDRSTGLGNRAALAERLEALYAAREATASSTALVMIVVEKLHMLGETYGPAVAEKAVKKVTAALRKSVKRRDFTARIGPDEFAFLFYEVDAQAAQTITARLRDQIQSLEIRLPDRDFSGLRLGLSAGIALSSEARDATDLVDRANLALKAVREGGRQGILLCTPRMGAQLNTRREKRRPAAPALKTPRVSAA